MLNQIDVLVHYEHYKDLLREAEQAQLARFAVSGRPAKKTAKKAGIRKSTQLVETPCCNPAAIACCAA
jgi:hypothetical protein